MTIILILTLTLYSIIGGFLSGLFVYHIIKRQTKPHRLPTLYPIDVSMDCLFTVREKEAIIESLLMWQEATCGLITFHIVNTGNNKLIYNEKERKTASYAINFIRALDEDQEVKESDERWKKRVLGFAQGFEPCGLAFIVADRNINRRTFVATCAHEVGHLLGLCHHPSKNALMYEYICQPGPTQLDLQELVNIWRSELNRKSQL